MTASDLDLLRELSRSMNEAPFAHTVNVLGQPLSRSTARSMERLLLRIRFTERKNAPQYLYPCNPNPRDNGVRSK